MVSGYRIPGVYGVIPRLRRINTPLTPPCDLENRFNDFMTHSVQWAQPIYRFLVDPPIYRDGVQAVEQWQGGEERRGAEMSYAGIFF